jgi:predicted phosphodiesterase
MREIFVSDIHWPHHDKAAWNIALKIVAARKPDIVHIGGDGVDFHSISRHPKQLIDRTILTHEVKESRRELARLRKAAPNARINFQEGNHDARMQIYLRDRAPELSELFDLTFPNLMKLSDQGIIWIPEKQKMQIGKLWHHHGHLIAGGGMFPAKNKFLKLYQNIIFGHHHRFDYFSINQYGTNELYQSIGNGCLYTLEPDYAHHTHWQMGITEINYTQSGDFAHTFIHIPKHPDGSSRFALVGGANFDSGDDEDIDKFLSTATRRSSTRK